MHNQFYSGMRMKDVIDQLRPKTILEVGFGAGTNVLMLLCYSKALGHNYRLISLSEDHVVPNITLPHDFITKFVYVGGISYRLIPKWKEIGLPDEFNGLIDLCIIDSDHNYYTLKKELSHLDAIMADRCAIAFHDTASKPCEHHLYYSNALDKDSNAMVQTTGYKDGSPYPMKEVMETLHIPMMAAIEEFLESHPDYKMLKHIDECCGCTLIGRNFNYIYQNEIPGIIANGTQSELMEAACQR